MKQFKKNSFIRTGKKAEDNQKSQPQSRCESPIFRCISNLLLKKDKSRGHKNNPSNLEKNVNNIETSYIDMWYLIKAVKVNIMSTRKTKSELETLRKSKNSSNKLVKIVDDAFYDRGGAFLLK